MLTCVWAQVKCLIPFLAEHFEITFICWGVVVVFEQLSPYSLENHFFFLHY